MDNQPKPKDEPLKTYIGPYQVATTEDLPDPNMIRVRYAKAEGDAEERYEDINRDIYHATCALDPYDLTSLRQKRMSKVVETILSVMTLYNVKVDEVNYLTSLLIESVNHSLDRADGKLWRRPGEKARDLHDRAMRDIDSVLKAE